jgi:hypothetical protein
LKPEKANVEKHIQRADSIKFDDATERIKRNQDAKYESADLQFFFINHSFTYK